MSTENYEPGNYTGEVRHHMLKAMEQARLDGVVVVAHEHGREPTKLRQKSSIEEKSG